MKPLPQFRKKTLFLAAGALYLLLLPFGVVKSQNDPPTFLGQSPTVTLIPWGTVHAGRITYIADSDFDGLPDAYETQYGLNPFDPADADFDPDNDGLRNGDEYRLGTNPRVADTDGDGFNDGVEVSQGYDPLNPNSHPPAGVQLTSLQVAPTPIGLSLNTLLPGNPVQLTVTGTLSDATTIDVTNNPATSYQSLNSGVAVVDGAGRVAAVSAGVTTIRVRNASLTADAAVTVTSFTPGPVAVVPLPGFANNVEVSGNFAFVACGLAGLQVVDATNPATPQVVASLALAGNANDLYVAGNLAYIAAGDAGVQIVDISNPHQPALVGGVAFNSATDIVVRNGRAYVAAGADGLKIVDVSTPAAPVVLGTFPIAQSSLANGVDADPARNLAVLSIAETGFDGRVQVIDVSNPAAPVGRGTLPFQFCQDVSLNGATLLVGQFQGLTKVDLSNPDQLQVITTNSNLPGITCVKPRNGIAFTSMRSFSVGAVGLFTLSNPPTLPYLGTVLANDQFDRGTGVAATDTLVFLTAGRRYYFDNGISGDSALLLGQYRQGDTAGIAPIASFTRPVSSTTLVAGEQIPVQVAAFDDVAVASVEIKANGTTLATLNNPPYQVTYPVPAGTGTVQFTARALDTAGNMGTATPVTVAFGPDPLTTVTGIAQDSGQPVAGATVTLDGTSRTTTTDGSGAFSFAGMGTVPAGIQVSATVETGFQRGQSGRVTTVRGGTTDLGVVRVARVGTTPLPAILSALGVGDYGTDSVDDLFIGFSDRPSQVYLSNQTGQFTPSSSYILPFGAVRSGASVDLNRDFKIDVLAQPVGQTGAVTQVFSDGNGGVAGSGSLTTGLAGESEFTVSGYDFNNTSTPVLVFVRVTGGTQVTARIYDGAGGFLAPFQVTTDPAAPLRALRLVDVTGDGLVDLVGIKEFSLSDHRLIVFPRLNATSFGAPIESPVVLRSVTSTLGTFDCTLEDFTGDGVKDVAVLGDTVIRIYAGNGNGGFRPMREIPLLPGTTPLGLAAQPVQTMAGGTWMLVVNVKELESPLNRTLLLYLGNSGEVSEYHYQAISDAQDDRVVIGSFDVGPSADIAVIDEQRVTTFLNLGPIGPQSRASAGTAPQFWPDEKMYWAWRRKNWLPY